MFVSYSHDFSVTPEIKCLQDYSWRLQESFEDMLFIKWKKIGRQLPKIFEQNFHTFRSVDILCLLFCLLVYILTYLYCAHILLYVLSLRFDTMINCRFECLKSIITFEKCYLELISIFLKKVTAKNKIMYFYYAYFECEKLVQIDCIYCIWDSLFYIW